MQMAARCVGIAADEKKGHPEIDEALPFVNEEILDHITLQETAAAADRVMKTGLRRNHKNCVLLAQIDATVVVKYIRCLGGRIPMLTMRVRELQRLLRSRHIQLEAGSIKGELNPSDAPPAEEC